MCSLTNHAIDLTESGDILFVKGVNKYLINTIKGVNKYLINTIKGVIACSTMYEYLLK